MTLAARCYSEINRRQDEFGSSASFIANVILTGSSKPGTRLKNMLARLNSGQHFSALSFRMPYEGFFIDGVAVKPEILLAKPDASIEDFRLND